jgi:ribosomal protein S18 acetylase RimI-like enzyme
MQGDRNLRTKIEYVFPSHLFHQSSLDADKEIDYSLIKKTVSIQYQHNTQPPASFNSARLIDYRNVLKHYGVSHISKESNMDEIKLFHKKMFPVKYSDSFYENLLSSNVHSLLVHDQSKESHGLVGVATARIMSIYDSPEKLSLKPPPSLSSSPLKRRLITHGHNIHDHHHHYHDKYAPRIGYIMTLAVTPRLQNKGIGSFMLVNLIHAMKTAGVERIELDVLPNNKAAYAMYMRQGFEHVSTKYSYYEINGHTYDAHHLILKLK